MGQHHILSPSASDRWLSCPGSLFGPRVADEGSSYAREGTACHSLLEDCLKTGFEPRDFLGKVYEDPEFPVSEEMVYGVELFLNTLKDVLNELGLGWDRVISERHLVHPHIEGELFGGTTDCLIVGDDVLVVMDLKFGHKPVFANGTQLTCYTLLALPSMGRSFKRVIQMIVQPKIGNVDRHEVGSDELTAVWEGVQRTAQLVLDTAAAGKLHEPPTLQLLATGDHCKYCPRKAGCPAIVNTVVSAVAAKDSAATLDQMSLEALVHWSEQQEAIETWLGEVDKMLALRASQGHAIPGKKLVVRWGHKKWNLAEEELLKKLPRITGLPVRSLKETKVCSPAKVQDATKKAGKLDKDVQAKLDGLIDRHVIGVKLVNERARGEEVRPETAFDFLQRLNKESEVE